MNTQSRPQSHGFINQTTNSKFQRLIHQDIKNHYQFITFRTYDSVDSYLKKLSRQNIPNNQKQMQIDQYQDRSSVGSYLNHDVLNILYLLIQKYDQQLYQLIAFCIMPNHVHLLIKPEDEMPVIIRRLKGSSSKRINKHLGKTGKFWAPNYYDKLIRDEKHFLQVYDYIKNNPRVLSESKSVSPRFYGIYEQPGQG